MLDLDSSLFCIAAFNDFAYQHLVDDNAKLLRTQYFPGVAWLITKDLWMELTTKVAHIPPGLSMSDWLRLSTIHQNRECIIPEISRAKPISNELFLKYIRLSNDADVDFGDVSYLLEEVCVVE